MLILIQLNSLKHNLTEGLLGGGKLKILINIIIFFN